MDELNWMDIVMTGWQRTSGSSHGRGQLDWEKWIEEIDCMRLAVFGGSRKGLGSWILVDKSDGYQAKEVLGQ